MRSRYDLARIFQLWCKRSCATSFSLIHYDNIKIPSFDRVKRISQALPSKDYHAEFNLDESNPKEYSILFYLSTFVAILSLLKLANASTSDTAAASDTHTGNSQHPPADDECLIQTPETSSETVRKRRKKVGFREQRIAEYENRLRYYSSPDKIFRYFATLKLVHQDGSFDIFMTPKDFVRSLTPNVLQPRRYGLDKFKVHNYNDFVGKQEGKDDRKIFHWINDDHGLINFGDYLFLMTVLATSSVEFGLAFRIYDLNQDGELDLHEFEKVQELVLSQSNVGQRHRDHITGTGTFKKAKTKTSEISKHFFGIDGKNKLKIEEFLEFQKNLHRDILRIEFERRDPESGPLGIISEVMFAELLLIHTNLPEKRRRRMLKQVKRRYKNLSNKKGVSFDEVNDFFLMLYEIDKVDLALHFHRLAGRTISKELLKKVAKRVTGVELSDTVLDVTITLFDKDGDGQLSHHEFVAIMKRRMQRGIERPKDTGLFRLLTACWRCGKKQASLIAASYSHNKE